MGKTGFEACQVRLWLQRVECEPMMANLRYVALGILVCMIASCSAGARGPAEQPGLPQLVFSQGLQEALDEVLPMARGAAQLGISAAVVVPGYEIWTGTSGYSHAGTPVTADMLFDAGSIAKNFEAALVLQLTRDGTLALDDPIATYLSPHPAVDGSITVRQLLNHTSGVFNVFEHPDFPWVGAEVDYSQRWELDEVLSTFVGEPYGPPGYAQHYASTNYLLLTAIIAEATGDEVPELMERTLLQPAGLEQTMVSMGEPPAGAYSVAHPWVDVDEDGTLEDLFGIPLTWKVSLTHPVLFSTAGDLARWVQALYHDRTVLDPVLLEEMLTYPEVSIRDPEGGRYGLGVVDYSDVLGVQVVGHGGSSLGYSAAALYLPEYGVSLAWLINTGESPAELANQLMGDVWSSLFQVLSANREAL